MIRHWRISRNNEFSRIPPVGNHAPGNRASFGISMAPVFTAEFLQERRYQFGRVYSCAMAPWTYGPGKCYLSNFYTQKMA